MGRIIALFVSLVIFTIHSHAQKWNQIKQEVGITFGGVFPIDYFEKGGNVTFETIYSKYHQSGIGFRTGFRYFSEVAEYKHALGIPLAIAYRWSFKDLDFFESGMNAARHSAMNNGGLVEMIASFFLSLNQSIVFFAGVTPGIVIDPGNKLAVGSSIGGINIDYYKTNSYPFVLSLDVGASLNYYFGRVRVYLLPVFCYIPTSTYRLNEVKIIAPSKETFTKDIFVHCLFNVSIGVGIAF